MNKIFVIIKLGEDSRQKVILDFLVRNGEELIQVTEKFLHEQRRLGHEASLQALEKHNLDLELLVIDLKNQTSKFVDYENEKFLHEIHQVESKIFNLEQLIQEEILSMTKSHLLQLKSRGYPQQPFFRLLMRSIV